MATRGDSERAIVASRGECRLASEAHCAYRPSPAARHWLRNDVDPGALAVELDCSRRQGEEGVVLAPADVAAWMEAGAALADDDAAGSDRLAAVDLDAETLAMRIAAVANRTLTFFMCHGGNPAVVSRSMIVLWIG